MWRGLHFLTALSVPFVLTLLMSCMKAEEEKADFGPEIPASSIDLALSKAIHNADLSGTAVGQFLSYSVTRRLENEETTINLGGTRVSVFDKVCDPVDCSAKLTFTLKIEKTTRLADNTFEVRQSEEPLILRKGPIAPASFGPTPGKLSAASLAQHRVGALAKKPTRVSFHRLRESDGNMDVPAVIKNKPGCGGLSPCELPVHYVQFDMVQWFSDETYQKISLDFAFSLKTPYLPFGEDFDQLNGVLVTDCRATQIPVEGRTVYLRDCMSLEDLQK